jgi:hypothetical protein
VLGFGGVVEAGGLDNPQHHPVVAVMQISA